MPANDNTILLLHFVEMEAVAIPTNEKNITDIFFPDLDGNLEEEFGNAPAQAKIPRDLFIQIGI